MEIAANRIQHNKRITFRVIKYVILVSSVMIIGFLFSYQPVSAYPQIVISLADQKDIDEARQKKEETEDQLDDIQAKIDALQGDASSLDSDLSYLNQLSAEQQAQYEEIAGELQAALTEKQTALDMYLQSQDTLAQKQTEYSTRMSVMFEYQNMSTLEILLESDSVAGFFTNMELISLIGDADQQIMDELQAAVDDAQLKSDYAQQEAIDMQAIADQKQAELDDLEARIGQTADALEETQADISAWEEKEDELEAVSDSLDSQIAQLQAALKKTTSTTAPPEGSMTWPYPGDYTIYSPFGMRMHPIYHVQKMHTGVDLGGVYGNPIVAAADGTVILVSEPVEGQNTGGTGYGNYVVIDHGGGVSTLYGHCKDVLVAVGDTVTAGEQIAICGSTGTSTGAHLHFEVRVNGQKVNPADYIT